MKDFQHIYDEAQAAATQAILKKFANGDREAPFNCGFAWVKISGATAFGRWAKANGLARPAYPSGLQFWKPGDWPSAAALGFPIYGQDMDFHLAGALAFATRLSDFGIPATVDYRLD